MAELFLQTINISITASWLVLTVLAARLLLKKAPKWINVLLWGMVAVRLLVPISLESSLSLVPSTETVRPEIMTDPSPGIDSGIPVLDTAVNAIIGQLPRPTPVEQVNPLQIWIPVLSYLWIAGFAALLAYTVFTYLRLRFRVREAVRYQGNVYLSENAGSPFVLGILKPRVYLPYNMEQADMDHVIAHEQAHIRRKDHWWKPAGFLLLSVHWFNPLMWIAYILLCRDIELACDEKVIKNLEETQRVEYSQTLLRCSIRHKTIAACPLAFGEDNVKKRIKKVLNYKKPAFWIVVIALIACVAVCVFFLTDPMKQPGIQGISIAREEEKSITLNIPYRELNGYSVVQLNEDAGEYTSEGEIPYSGDLGKYRIMITFPDTQPTDAFADQFPEGQVCYVGRAATVFGASLKVKRVQMKEQGFILYIGSYIPVSVEDQSDTEGDPGQGNIAVEIKWDQDKNEQLPTIEMGIPEKSPWESNIRQAAAILPLRPGKPIDFAYFMGSSRDVKQMLEMRLKADDWDHLEDVYVDMPLSSVNHNVYNRGLDLSPYLTDKEGFAKLMWDQLPAGTPLSILDQARDPATGGIYIFPYFVVENGEVVLKPSGSFIQYYCEYPDLAFRLLVNIYYGESNAG